jgi:hypothetical protein
VSQTDTHARDGAGVIAGRLKLVEQASITIRHSRVCIYGNAYSSAMTQLVSQENICSCPTPQLYCEPASVANPVSFLRWICVGDVAEFYTREHAKRMTE